MLADDLITIIWFHLKLITFGPYLNFPNNKKLIMLLVKQLFIKSHARRTDSAVNIGLETTPLILISVGL